jgi:replication factor C subunit 1
VIGSSLKLYLSKFFCSTLTDVLQNTVINFGGKQGQKQTKSKGKGRVIVMDEVDGVSGNSDRGGLSEISQLIKTTKTPIICICNDRQDLKMRTLANHCYDLRFQRPTKSEILARLRIIGEREGLQMDDNAIDFLIESTSNDIRQMLNAMQMWRKSSDSMGYKDLKDNMASMEKDGNLRLNPFDATSKIFNDVKSKSVSDRLECYFVDYSLVPLMVSEQYAKAISAR